MTLRDSRSVTTKTMAASAAILALGFAPSRTMDSLRDDRPNRADTERMERGYYERLLDSGRSLDALPATPAAPMDAGRLCDMVADLREYVLKPNVKTSHRGASWTTSAHAMRDREYALRKPDGTLRMAIVGDSIGAGWGVDDGRNFESLLENELSKTHPVEILNHSVPGHSPGQRWEHFRRTGEIFSPDVVLFQATPADLGWDDRRLRVLLPKGLGWDAPQYEQAIQRSGVRLGQSAESLKTALRAHREKILGNVYRTAVAECRSLGAVPAWVLIPRVGKPIDPAEHATLIAMARDAGFAIVIDLSNEFSGIDATDLEIAPDDFHPNARGHRILADGLRSALEQSPAWRTRLEGPR